MSSCSWLFNLDHLNISFLLSIYYQFPFLIVFAKKLPIIQRIRWYNFAQCFKKMLIFQKKIVLSFFCEQTWILKFLKSHMINFHFLQNHRSRQFWCWQHTIITSGETTILLYSVVWVMDMVQNKSHTTLKYYYFFKFGKNSDNATWNTMDPKLYYPIACIPYWL